MEIARTQRLMIRELEPADAGFLLQMLNEPSFHKYIGDKGVRTEVDALAYMRERYIKSYRENGFGLWALSRINDNVLVGMNGLIKRPDLEFPEIGYGLLEAHWGQGYALESGRAVLQYANEVLKIPKVIALTSQINVRSAKVLERLGMKRNGEVFTEDYPEGSLLFEQQ